VTIAKHLRIFFLTYVERHATSLQQVSFLLIIESKPKLDRTETRQVCFSSAPTYYRYLKAILLTEQSRHTIYPKFLESTY